MAGKTGRKQEKLKEMGKNGENQAEMGGTGRTGGNAVQSGDASTHSEHVRPGGEKREGTWWGKLGEMGKNQAEIGKTWAEVEINGIK